MRTTLSEPQDYLRSTYFTRHVPDEFDHRVKELLHRRKKVSTEDQLRLLDQAKVKLNDASLKLYDGMKDYQTALGIQGDFRFDLREMIRLQIERCIKAEHEIRVEDSKKTKLSGKDASVGSE